MKCQTFHALFTGYFSAFEKGKCGKACVSIFKNKKICIKFYPCHTIMARSFFVEKIKIYQGDGKTREEKESCFPCVKTGENIKNKGAGI